MLDYEIQYNIDENVTPFYPPDGKILFFDLFNSRVKLLYKETVGAVTICCAVISRHYTLLLHSKLLWYNHPSCTVSGNNDTIMCTEMDNDK